jgi:hypothetical protein
METEQRLDAPSKRSLVCPLVFNALCLAVAAVALGFAIHVYREQQDLRAELDSVRTGLGAAQTLASTR